LIFTFFLEKESKQRIQAKKNLPTAPADASRPDCYRDMAGLRAAFNKPFFL
jgi:hypothetical protein